MMTEAESLSIKGEVDEYDIYRLRDRAPVVSINDPNYIHEAGHSRAFSFEPEIIFDIGANVGHFTRYARRLYPNAKIISVEPNPDNIAEFKQRGGNEILIEKAIGHGTLYHVKGINGGGENYLSVGMGYSEKSLQAVGVRSEVPTITLVELAEQYLEPGKKFIIKMDIEGAENVIFCDPSAWTVLRAADYFTCELHYFASGGDKVAEVRERTDKFLKSMEKTHRCSRNGVIFHAVKL